MPDSWTKLLQRSGITKLMAKSGLTGDEMKERSKVYDSVMSYSINSVFFLGCCRCVKVLYSCNC